MNHILKVIQIIGASFLLHALAGCSSFEDEFTAPASDGQGDFETKANYELRQPVREVRIPFLAEDTLIAPDKTFLVWAKYDVELGRLQFDVPTNESLMVRERMLPVFQRYPVFLYLQDSSLANAASLKWSMPFKSTPATKQDFKAMFWVVRYRRDVLRDQPVQTVDYGERRAVVVPIKLLAVELHAPERKLWAYALTKTQKSKDAK